MVSVCPFLPFLPSVPVSAGLPTVPDLPGLSRFGARCHRRVPHRDIKVSRFVKI